MSKRKTSVIAIAVLTCLVCASIIAGATFALFTDSDQVNVSVTTAKLDVTANIENVATNCTLPTANGRVRAAYDKDAKLLTVTDMLPGDVITFRVDVISDATVDVKYRMSFGCEDADNALFAQLLLGVKDTAEAQNYDYYVSSTSAWETIPYAAEQSDRTVSKYVAIELPAYVNSEQLHQANCNIKFAVEAVQGNAAGDKYEAEASAVRAYRVTTDEQFTKAADLVKDGDCIVLDATEVKNWNLTTTSAATFSVKGCDVDTLTVNAPNAKIDYRVNYTRVVTVEETAPHSLHVYGTVTEKLTVKEGRAVIEKGAQVAQAEVAPEADKTAAIVANEAVAKLTVAGEGTANVAVAKEVVVKEVEVTNVGATSITNNGTIESVKADENANITSDGESTGALNVCDLATFNTALKIGGEIVLTDDIAVSQPIMLSKSTTINGQGHNIVSSANRIIRIDTNDVEVSLIDVNLLRNGNNAVERAVQVDMGVKGVKLDIRGCKLEASYYTVNICNDADVALTISRCDMTGWGVINAWSANYSINVEDSVLRGINDKSYSLVGWNGFGTVVIEGDTTGKTEDHATQVDIALTRCTIIAESKNRNIQKGILFNSQSRENNVVLTDCTFELENEYCCSIVDNGTDNNVKLVNTQYAETPVSTAEEFIAALNTTQHIMLTNDIKVDTKKTNITIGTSIDLNGHTLSGTVSLNLTKGLTLNVYNGSMNIDAIGAKNGYSALYVEAGSTLRMVRVNLTTNGYGVFVEGNEQTKVQGYVVMDGCEVQCTYAALGTNASGNGRRGPVTVDIYGTVINSEYCGVLINVSGTLTIEGCEINAVDQAVLARGGNTTIKNSVLKTTAQHVYAHEKSQDADWGSGTSANNGALVLGNKNNASYKYPTSVTLQGVTLIGSEVAPAIYMWSDTQYTCTLTYDANTVINGNVYINGEHNVINKKAVTGEHTEMPQ